MKKIIFIVFSFYHLSMYSVEEHDLNKQAFEQFKTNISNAHISYCTIVDTHLGCGICASIKNLVGSKESKEVAVKKIIVAESERLLKNIKYLDDDSIRQLEEFVTTYCVPSPEHHILTEQLLVLCNNYRFNAEIYQQRALLSLEDYKKDLSEEGCIICMANPCQVLFSPCRHYAVCEECSKDLKQCLMCREKITKKYVLALEPYICLQCGKNPSNILTSCNHLVVCDTCSTNTSKCPFPQCQKNTKKCKKIFIHEASH